MAPIPAPVRLRRVLVPLVLAGLVGCFGGGGGPERGLYQWVDEDGVVHYTTHPELVPDRYRSNSRQLSGERGDRQAATASPAGARRQPRVDAGPIRDLPPPPGARPVERALPPLESAPPRTLPGAAAPQRRPLDAAAARERERRIAELEQAIARDRELLKDLISQEQSDAPELADDPELREIAERLAGLEADLAALRRAALRRDAEP